MILKISKIVNVVLLSVSLFANTHADSSSIVTKSMNWIGNNVVMLPDYRLTMDASTFTLHKSTFFKEQYLAEVNPHFEFTFVSFADRVFSVWDTDFLFGLGNLPDDVVFSVLSIAFGIAPAIELRLDPLNIKGGWDHHCFHEIDRKTYSIVYWNTLHLSLASTNYRYGDYWKPLVHDDGWTLKNRFSWQLIYNYYVKYFGSLVAPSKLNGNNPRLGDLRADYRFSFYRRRSWIVNASGATLIGLQNDNSIEKNYWRVELGLEMHFRRGVKGATFYSKYTLDDMPLVDQKPRFSKDQLVQFGFRFFD